MIEIIFNAPDLPTLANAAVAMGYYDAVSKTITASGSLATGGGYFLNLGDGRKGITFYNQGSPLPGIWGRLRHNGDLALVPPLPSGSGITLYRYYDALGGWSVDGVTLAPSYIANIGVIA